jgi:MoxR-like ATPase
MARPAGMKMIEHMPPAFDPHQFRLVIERAREVAVSQSLRGYVADLVEATRNHHDLRLGVSTRGTLVLLAVARAFAMANSRNFVTADDIKALGVPVLAHRIALTAEAEIDGLTEAAVLQSILDQVPVPRATQAPLDP